MVHFFGNPLVAVLARSFSFAAPFNRGLLMETTHPFELILDQERNNMD